MASAEAPIRSFFMRELLSGRDIDRASLNVVGAQRSSGVHRGRSADATRRGARLWCALENGMRARPEETRKPERITAAGACVCGAVRFEIDTPALWAWHDHSAASRHAQGCAYATYVGSWKSRFRWLAGE